MPPVLFEPANAAGELPQTYALDRMATGTGIKELGDKKTIESPKQLIATHMRYDTY